MSSFNCTPNQVACNPVLTDPFCLDANKWKCKWYGLCDCPALQADPDIAGPGVILSFVIAAFLTLLATIGYLVMRPLVKERRVNRIDEWWTTRICVPIRKLFKTPDLWSECLFRVVLAFSDQQLVTGIAILVAGFKMLGTGSISVYHFSIVLDMAWFSSNCHMLCMMAISQYFSGEAHRAKKHGLYRTRFSLPFIAKWRVGLMLVLCGLLIAGSWVASYRYWGDSYNCPTNCMSWSPFQWSVSSKDTRWGIYSLVALVYGYTLSIIRLVEVGRGRNLGKKDWIVRKDLLVRSWLHRFPILLRCYIPLRTGAIWFRYFWASEVTELMAMCAWFGIGCHFTRSDRKGGHSIMTKSEIAKENSTGFGQLVPVLLLMVPFMAFMETHYELTEENTIIRRDTEEELGSGPIRRSADGWHAWSDDRPYESGAFLARSTKSPTKPPLSDTEVRAQRSKVDSVEPSISSGFTAHRNDFDDRQRLLGHHDARE